MRNSKKRNKIIEVFENGDLLTAKEVYERLPDLDKATIYRNLSFLTSEGFLREVNIRKGVSSYELNKDNDFHQHFICRNCEKIIPVDVNPNKIKKILPKEIEFEEFELNLKGRCADCKSLFFIF